jgi:hypothetical protein
VSALLQAQIKMIDRVQRASGAEEVGPLHAKVGREFRALGNRMCASSPDKPTGITGQKVAPLRAEDVGDKKDGFKQDLHFAGAQVRACGALFGKPIQDLPASSHSTS